MDPYKSLQYLSDVTFELIAQDGSTFHSHRNHVLPYYPKEPILFSYLRQYHSTPSPLNNPDTELYQDVHSNSPPFDDINPFEQFQSTDSDSTDSDSEMLHNLIYQSTSFPKTFPRVADWPECIFSPPPDAKTSPVHIRAPRPTYNVCSLPSKDYNTSKPIIIFPP